MMDILLKSALGRDIILLCTILSFFGGIVREKNTYCLVLVAVLCLFALACEGGGKFGAEFAPFDGQPMGRGALDFGGISAGAL